MTNNLSVILKKYSIPALLFILGLVMLIIGLTQGQNSMFILASVLMFGAGALSVMFSSGNLKPKLVMIFGVAAGIAGVLALVLSYVSVNTTQKYQEDYQSCKSLSIQNLQDIRYIQKAYAEKTGQYLTTWDEFVEFTKNGTVPFLESVGSVPARKIKTEENNYLYKGNPPVDNDMTEDEAYRLSKWAENPYSGDFANFVRDTVQRSLMSVKFGTKSYASNREKSGFYVFSADSLPYIPYTNGKTMWSIETKDSVAIGDQSFPTILIQGMIPFTKIEGKSNGEEKMFFGSISLNELSGSWED